MVAARGHDRFSARAFHLGCQRPCVRIANLVRRRGLRHFENFVSRGDNRYAGALVNRNSRVSRRGEPRNARVIDSRAAVQNDIALVRFTSGMRDIRSRRSGLRRFHGSVVMPRAVLHHDDSISSPGNGRAGHDFDCLSRADFFTQLFTGSDLANDAKTARQIRRAHGETIANGTVERRIVTIGDGVFRENTAGTFGESDV